MPKLDQCHEQVVRALQKDGWVVDKRPQRLRYDERSVYIDIRATRRMNGRAQQILLVEVKCFPDRNSTTEELYIALGQYIIYQAMLAQKKFDIPLYLAVPEDAYNNIFDEIVQHAVSNSKIKLLIINLDMEKIVAWKE